MFLNVFKLLLVKCLRYLHFRKASRGIIRSVLIQLEEMKVTEQLENGGRRITRVGQQDLDRIAGSVFRANEDED